LEERIAIPAYDGDGEAVFAPEKAPGTAPETKAEPASDDFLDTLDDDNDDEDGKPLSDEDLYEVVCPSCNDSIYLTEKMLAAGSINCPGCGELLEFDMTEEN
jgi:hypothetical protein